jgi:hypothetical protein
MTLPLPPFFSPTCIWNAKLTSGETVLSALTAASIAKFNRWIFDPKTGLVKNPPYINTLNYSTPIYTVPAGAPKVPVTVVKPYSAALLEMAALGVPIPSGAQPAGGSDRHMVVWQPSTDTMWEFIGMRQDAAGKWLANWGGRLLQASASPGHYRNRWGQGGFGPKRNVTEDKTWGSTACSLPMAAGIALISELQAGVIPHALSMALPDCKKSVWVYPAQRTDGGDLSADAIPEGTRFRIDPAVDITKLGLPPIGLVFARAAQDYGIIVNDKSLSAVGFRAEDPGPLTRAGQPNPYTKLFVDAAKKPLASYQILAKFPWAHLQQLAPPTNQP